MKRVIFLPFIAFFVMALGPTISEGIIIAKLDPSTTNVTVGSSFEIDLLADIPENESIAGFGLDLVYDDALLSFDAFDRNISLFPYNTHGLIDTDPIEGLVGWYNRPDRAWGQDVLLGTIQLTCLGEGVSILDLEKNDDGWVPYAFWEVSGYFTPDISREWAYWQAEIVQTPVPEPATVLMLGSGLIGLAGLRRKFRKR